MNLLTRLFLRFLGRWMMTGDLATQRARQQRSARWMPISRSAHFAPIPDAPFPGEWVLPSDPRPGAMLYLHGGGYVLGSPQEYRVLTGALAAALEIRLLVPAYRLAPEHPFPAALEDALVAFRWMATQVAGPLWVAGDSAGGGLALAVLLQLRDTGERSAAGGVLFSPWVDLTLSSPSVSERSARDPILTPAFLETCARRYAGGFPRDHPLLSPLFDDLRGLPPLLIHVGTEEILFDDARRLSAAARAAGVTVRLRVWEGMPHAFVLFPLFAAVPQALAESAAWVWH